MLFKLRELPEERVAGAVSVCCFFALLLQSLRCLWASFVLDLFVAEQHERTSQQTSDVRITAQVLHLRGKMPTQTG